MKNIVFILMVFFYGAFPFFTNAQHSCPWSSYFISPKPQSRIAKGEPVYVIAKAKYPKVIKTMALYVDKKFIRTIKNENYDWGPKFGDKYLQNLKCGKHVLKVKIVDTCGKTNYMYNTFYIECETSPCQVKVPTLSLKFQSSNTRVENGVQVVYYNLGLLNYHKLAYQLFSVIPKISPCNNRKYASRAYAEVVDDRGNILQSFCTPRKAVDLKITWFKKKWGKKPPSKVRIRLIDRECNKKVYYSNYVKIPPHSIY